jgi:hypothetical protein
MNMRTSHLFRVPALEERHLHVGEGLGGVVVQLLHNGVEDVLHAGLVDGLVAAIVVLVHSLRVVGKEK